MTVTLLTSQSTPTATDADALVTDSPGIWLAVYAADCVPVLLVDPERPAVAALHARYLELAGRPRA